MENKPIPPRKPGARPVGKPIIIKARPKPVDPARIIKPREAPPEVTPPRILKEIPVTQLPEKPKQSEPEVIHSFTKEESNKLSPPVSPPSDEKAAIVTENKPRAYTESVKPIAPIEKNNSESVMDKKVVPPVPPKPTRSRIDEPSYNSSGSDSLKTILIISNLLFLAACAYLLYDKITRENQLADQLVVTQTETINYKTDIERKVAEIGRLQDSIRAVIAEKEALGQELTGERAKVADLETLKNQVQSKQLSINALNNRLSKYKKEYENAQLSMESISSNNKHMIDSLTRQLQAKDDSLRVLNNVKSSLSQKVAMASGLHAENISVTVSNTAGKEVKQAASYRALSIGNVKAVVTLEENQVTDAGKKEIYMRLIEPTGSTLVEGNNNFKVNGNSISYTNMQSVEYTNKQQSVVFEHKKAGRYTPGRYTIEFYAEGNKIGHTNLILTK